MTKKIILIFTSLYCISSFASDWQQITSTETSVIAVDKQSITTSKGFRNRKAWITYDSTVAKLTTGYPAKPYFSMVQLEYFDCSERTAAAVQQIAYSGQTRTGEIVKVLNIPLSAAEFTEVVPDSVGEATLAYVCSAKVSR
ncbi:MAG: surface-adhesin E family protein [Collimonas pratensis]|uniref:surface-adhesin E family protein n=1 Tax=Collimonas pratensis TaxID=279113 RepID=UPI003C760039